MPAAHLYQQSLPLLICKIGKDLCRQEPKGFDYWAHGLVRPRTAESDPFGKRAREVAKIFESSGVGLADLYYKGAGADRPIATNLTAEGRAANRRVEVVELGTEEGIIAYDNFVESDPTLPSRVVKSQESPYIPRPPQTSKPATENKPELPSKTIPTVASLKSGSSIDFGGLPIDEFDQNLAANVEKSQVENLFFYFVAGL